MSHVVVKLVVCGPRSSGKSYICNQLSAPAQDTVGVRGHAYFPTSGARICEFTTTEGGAEKVTELWDLSGDKKYKNTWNAVAHKVDGIIFVFNTADATSGGIAELKFWHNVFYEACEMTPNRCLIVANTPIDRRKGQVVTQITGMRKFSLPPELKDVRVHECGSDFDATRKVLKKLVVQLRRAKERKLEEFLLT